MKNGEIISDITLSEAGGKLNLVPADHPLIERARGFGMCFGEPKDE